MPEQGYQCVHSKKNGELLSECIENLAEFVERRKNKSLERALQDIRREYDNYLSLKALADHLEEREERQYIEAEQDDGA